ncbi:MAG: S41 family peptidase [Armatimonadetes bacterium]|nr:S41 family peptidase [Armatimonadota bacterium]
MKRVLNLWMTLLAAQCVFAQEDIQMSADKRAQTIDAALRQLNAGYVFPEIARKMESSIRARQKKGDYDWVTSGNEFAQLLTQHLQEISKDKHLRVRCEPKGFPRESAGLGNIARRKEAEEFERLVNHGFEKVERLQGNVGYLKFNGFMDPATGGDTVAAAMSFLANTDAMIIDVRDNGGGSPEMVALICTYFFEDRRHLNDLYFRPENTTEQYWTLPYVPGKKYIGKDVYILTSNRTFSAAEEFTYNMKTQKRATVVGETTGGGANPGGFQRLNENFGMFLPTGRAINPITKTNWEGTGVAPDIATTRDAALKTAHLHVSRKLLAKVKNPMQIDGLKENIAKLEKDLHSKS